MIEKRPERKGTQRSEPAMRAYAPLMQKGGNGNLMQSAFTSDRESAMRVLIILLILMVSAPSRPLQSTPGYFDGVAGIEPGEPLESIVRKAARVRPSPRQVAWQELEFTCFIHFGMNTFIDREWGEKGASPRNFNPTALNARQ